MHDRHQWLLKEMSQKYIKMFPHQERRGGLRPEHKPWLMLSITCLQVAIFIFIYFRSKIIEPSDYDAIAVYCNTNGTLCNVLQFDPDQKSHVWGFLSYMLIHSGLGHFIGNMVLQLVLGIPLEVYNGWWRVLVVYLVGGVAGCLGHGLFAPKDENGQHPTLRGASAGDFALLTAHIASVVIVSNFLTLTSKLYSLLIEYTCF
jgi:membrane associated rhomboid family serine protease